MSRGIGIVSFLFVALICFIPLSPLFCQTVVLEINSISQTEKGFVVKGIVTASGLNPKGQVVESDSIGIMVDVQKGAGAQYPLLPTHHVIRIPPTAETHMAVGKRLLTRLERDGKNIWLKQIAAPHVRNAPVWQAYGGLGTWRKKAPTSVTREFEGIIPLEYAGKRVRIRALLRHQMGGPYAAWSAIAYFHDIGHEGVLAAGPANKPDSHKVYIVKGPKGSPNPVFAGKQVQFSISAKDTQNHDLSFSWSISPRAGRFSSTTIANPTWTAPANIGNKKAEYLVTCKVACKENPQLTAAERTVQMVCPVPKPFTITLKFWAPGFQPVEKTTRSYRSTVQKLVLYGPVMPVARNSDEAGIIGSDTHVHAQMIVKQGKRIIKSVENSVKMYGTYWLSLELADDADCSNKKTVTKRQEVRLFPEGSTQKKKKQPEKVENLAKIITEKYKNSSWFRRIWTMIGLYKAYQSDRDHIKAGGSDTPALNQFLKNLNQGRIGEMKNALNTIWEFSKVPLTAGGSAIEDMIQSTNKTWKRLTGKGFLKNPPKGWNAIKDTGFHLREKLKNMEKVL